MQTTISPKNSLIIIAVIMFITIWIYIIMTRNETDRIGIEKAIQNVVQPQLLNPGGATFSDDSNTKITKNDDGTYTVEGYIDDTNAFGGKIRNNYRATVRDEGNGNYEVDTKLQNAVTGEWQ